MKKEELTIKQLVKKVKADKNVSSKGKMEAILEQQITILNQAQEEVVEVKKKEWKVEIISR